MSLSREQIKQLAGFVDGSNRDFTTYEPYEAGSMRPIINGVIYDPLDSHFGLVETSDTAVRFNVAPLAGWHVAAFYREKVLSGSPYHPQGVYP